MAHAEGTGKERPFIPLNIAVLSISDTRTEQTDASGKALVTRLTDAGHHLHEKRIVPDDVYRIRAVIAHWIAEPEVQVVLTTGGTGVTGRDGTPEAVKVLFDKEIEGFGEVFRFLSYEEIKTSTLQSRAVAGVANGTYVFCVPGSSGACKTAWDKLIGHQLDYRTRPCNLVELMPRLKET
jgi:molybdenum cofactor biosynthesis protein B